MCKTSTVRGRPRVAVRATIMLFGVAALLAVSCLQSGAAHKHPATVIKTKPIEIVPQVQQDPPVKMRYYGGPKSPMYPG
jgi:hypothetical protein